MAEPRPPAATAAEFAVIGRYVEERSAILCPAEKQYLFEARLRPVLRAHNLASISELAAVLSRPFPGQVGDDVVEAMTTNETSWFRDIHPFEALRTSVIPELVSERQDSRQLSVWSAACSTGQELYSLAMMVDLHFPELAGWRVRMLGTDLSKDVVDQARQARYSSLEVNRGLPAQYLARYAQRSGTGYQLSSDIRQACEFRTLNFVEAWPHIGTFDLVLCRNVLIYFDLPMRERIIERISQVMNPGGYLMLGSSETSIGNVEGLVRTIHGRTTLYRKDLP